MSNKIQPTSEISPPYAGLSNPEQRIPIIAVDMPVMYEDEGQDEMGETDVHWRCCEILRNGLIAHFGKDSVYRVFSDLNVYYHPIDKWAYVSPDACVVVAAPELPKHVTSYRIGKDGSAPIIAMEVLSRRSAQQQDLTNKQEIYAGLGVPEYVIVDVTGEFLPERLLLKELEKQDGVWINRKDADSGVTSLLGFRVIIDDDGMIRMINAETGVRYPRPEEAHFKVEEANSQVEEVNSQVEEANAKLKELEEEKLQAELEIQQLKKELAERNGQQEH